MVSLRRRLRRQPRLTVPLAAEILDRPLDAVEHRAAVEEQKKRAAERVPAGGGFRILRRPRLLDNE